MFTEEIIRTKSMSGGIVVFLKKVIPNDDVWFNNEQPMYRVYLKDY